MPCHEVAGALEGLSTHSKPCDWSTVSRWTRTQVQREAVASQLKMDQSPGLGPGGPRRVKISDPTEDGPYAVWGASWSPSRSMHGQEDSPFKRKACWW